MREEGDPPSAPPPMDLTRALSPEPPEHEDGCEMSLETFKGSKQIRGLSRVSTLEQVLAKFSYQADDRLERREQVLIFRKTQSAFEQGIQRLVRARLYDEAKSRRQTLVSLREAFENLQKEERSREHERQGRLLEQAKKLAVSKLGSTHDQEGQHVEEYCTGLQAKLAKKHGFQDGNLEREIAGTVEPRMKNSTRLQYLKNAEKNLIRLYQYDDAKNVANMIRKLEPLEVDAHSKRFQRSLQLQRGKLHQNQEEERHRLHEFTTAVKWKDIRRREAERALMGQRIKNLTWDMEHSHAMEGHLRAEMAMHTSALLNKRPGYRLTGSGLRGQQFLDAVKGKSDKRDAVYVTTLTDIHDFKAPLSGTVAVEC